MEMTTPICPPDATHFVSGEASLPLPLLLFSTGTLPTVQERKVERGVWRTQKSGFGELLGSGGLEEQCETSALLSSVLHICL